ncbi:MAG: hypothetical protein ABL936_17340 [Aestuariivirga sp.]
MGFQIGFIAVLLLLIGCFIIFRYYFADSGLYFLERGRKNLGLGLFVGSAILLPAICISLLTGGYWLVFDGGAGFLLGIGLSAEN